MRSGRSTILMLSVVSIVCCGPQEEAKSTEPASANNRTKDPVAENPSPTTPPSSGSVEAPAAAPSADEGAPGRAASTSRHFEGRFGYFPVPRPTRIDLRRQSRYRRRSEDVTQPYLLENGAEGPYGRIHGVEIDGTQVQHLRPMDVAVLTGLPVREMAGRCGDGSLHPISAGACPDGSGGLAPVADVDFEHRYLFTVSAPLHLPMEISVEPEGWKAIGPEGRMTYMLENLRLERNWPATQDRIEAAAHMLHCIAAAFVDHWDGPFDEVLARVHSGLSATSANAPLRGEGYGACIREALTEDRRGALSRGYRFAPSGLRTRVLAHFDISEADWTALQGEKPELVELFSPERIGELEPERLRCPEAGPEAELGRCLVRQVHDPDPKERGCRLPPASRDPEFLADDNPTVALRGAKLEVSGRETKQAPIGEEESTVIDLGIVTKEMEAEEMDEDPDGRLTEICRAFGVDCESHRNSKLDFGALKAGCDEHPGPGPCTYLRTNGPVGRRGCDVRPILRSMGSAIEAAGICCGRFAQSRLGQPNAKLDLVLTFEAGANTGRIEILNDSLQDSAMNQCLDDALTHLRLPEPLTSECAVLLPLEFVGGPPIAQADRIEDKGGRVLFGGTAVTGSCDKQGTTARLRGATESLQACYDAARQSAPGLGGKLMFMMTINESGRPRGISARIDTTGNPKLQSCVKRVIRRLQFDPPSDEGECLLRSTIVFSPNRDL